MRVIAYGDIMDKGRSAFSSVTTIDGNILKITFGGELRVDAPFQFLQAYIDELRSLVPAVKVDEIEFDFRELTFCNSNGFYVVMDITELVVNGSASPILVRRLSGDDWHQETLPILLNADEPGIAGRLRFEEHDEV